MCWARVADGKPPLKRPWVNVSCVLAMMASRYSDVSFDFLFYCHGAQNGTKIVKCILILIRFKNSQTFFYPTTKINLLEQNKYIGVKQNCLLFIMI